MTDEAFDVVVAGAGPVGLSLAIELGLRGVRCLVVERNDRVGYSPRAKTTNARTREHLRRFGIADALRTASPISRDYPFDVVFATRMTGPTLARFTSVSSGGPERERAVLRRWTMGSAIHAGGGIADAGCRHARGPNPLRDRTGRVRTGWRRRVGSAPWTYGLV